MSKTIIGLVKEWHNPRNEDCRNNTDPALDCNCKRPQKRKPYRVVRVTDHGVSHRVSPHLIYEIWPNGALSMREKGRRKRFHILSCDLYGYLMRREAFAFWSKKQAAKRSRRASRRRVATAS